MNHRSVHRPALWLAVWAGAGALAVALGLMLGATGWEPWWQSPAAPLLWDLRWPRSLGAWLAGAALGVSGCVAQTLFRNPLADPYLLGSATGAGLGVGVMWWLSLWWGSTLVWSPALGGFVGAWLALALVITLARGQVHGTPLILAGLIVSVLLGATLSLLLRTHPQLMPALQGFLLGQTVYLDHQACLQMALVLAVGVTWAWWWGPQLDALSLGDDLAHSLGVNVPRVRRDQVLLMSALTAIAVAHVGLVAFVGWVAPHLVRPVLPQASRWRLLGAGLAGGAVLAVADLVARVVVAPQEWPVGIITAWVGGGWMLALMRRGQRTGQA